MELAVEDLALSGLEADGELLTTDADRLTRSTSHGQRTLERPGLAHRALPERRLPDLALAR
jgi:hypothetical protein